MNTPAASAAPEYDAAIVGGGMVGASLALALAAANRRVLIIEGVPPASAAQPSFDDRTTALGNASRRILESLGVWQQVAAQAGVIRRIHVSDAGRLGMARLDAAEQGIPAFGYVVANRLLGAALWERISADPNISVRVPATAQSVRTDDTGAGIEITAATTDSNPAAATAVVSQTARARLVIAADGARSAVRRDAGISAADTDYDQVAIVANVTTDTPNDGTAYERFTPAGPLALIPLHDGTWTVVWARRPDDAAAALAQEPAAFLSGLQQHFGWRAGRFTHVGKRASYPLVLTRADELTAQRTVLIGNAAQSLHPVAGQGFNLALRDVAALAELIAREPDPGAPALLQSFADWRARDRRGVVGFTDGLIRLFGDTRAPVRAARDAGLLLFDLLPPAKRALSRVSLGFGGRTPRLARGLKLK